MLLALPFGCSFHSLAYLQEGDDAPSSAGRPAAAGAQGSGGAPAAGGTSPVMTTAGTSPGMAAAGTSPMMGTAGTGGTAPAATECDADDGIGGDETDIDCGGRVCVTCAAGKHCLMGTDCASGICTNQACQAPSCSDLACNGDESDLNCGGSCSPCATGYGCRVGADCKTGSCVNAVCVAPNCAGPTPDAGCPLLIDNTAYSLRPADAPDSCIDVVGLGVDNGVEMQQYACYGGANQTFWALVGSGGYFSLRNALSGKCLQVRAKSLASGALIEQAGCSGQSEQLFLPSTGSAGMKLVIQSSGLSLDVAGAVSSSNGQRLVQSTDDGSLDMRWTAVKATGRGLVTLNALGKAGVLLRHVETVVRAETSLGPDSQWKIEPGLAADACVSFQSSDRPGAYLRHANALLWSDIFDGSANFSKDATFCFRPPLSGTDPASHALESFNYPGNYISASDGRVRLLTFVDSSQFRQLSTWVVAQSN
ncbi:MAG TPA: AbfB domain-containing protein [Polyangiaceae bacterium]